MKYEVERRYMDDMILEIVVVMVCEFCNEEMREGLWSYLYKEACDKCGIC
jgi:hypothetical protein